jgi:hypothetical protein
MRKTAIVLWNLFTHRWRVGFTERCWQFIQANESTGLVSITQVHPIYVQFAVAENYLEICVKP